MTHRLFKTIACAVVLAGTCQAMAEPVKPAPAHGATAKQAQVKTMDLNHATKAQLTTLPGITEALAGKIIAGRPYKVKSNLVTRKILTREGYEAMHKFITLGPNRGNKK